MIANYHTHTVRCSHAVGEDEEYILNAIKNGIKILGFSDHAPFKFPDGYESYFRVPTSKAGEYIKTFSAFKEKYKNDIEIHIGFEMEYYPLYFSDMLKGVKKLGAEYLILGQHFLGNEHPNGTITYRENLHKESLIEYVDTVIQAIKTLKFSYIAHPDVAKFESDEFYIGEARRLCLAAKEYDIPLEINLLGIRRQKHYPNSVFWKVAGEVGNKAVIGIDAHDPNDFFYQNELKIAEKIANDNSIEILKTINFKKL